MTDKIKNLIAELEHIARKNNDRFKYSIAIQTGRKELLFEFEAVETADGHTFVSGGGNNIEEAIAQASKNVPNAVEAWGYEL